MFFLLKPQWIVRGFPSLPCLMTPEGIPNIPQIMALFCRCSEVSCVLLEVFVCGQSRSMAFRVVLVDSSMNLDYAIATHYNLDSRIIPEYKSKWFVISTLSIFHPGRLCIQLTYEQDTTTRSTCFWSDDPIHPYGQLQYWVQYPWYLDAQWVVHNHYITMYPSST